MIGCPPVTSWIGLPVFVCRCSVGSIPISRTRFPAEFGGDHDLSVKRRQSFAHEFFVGKRPIYFRGVEECDAVFHSGTEKSDHLLLFFWRAIGPTHSHAAKADGRNFQALPEFAL